MPCVVACAVACAMSCPSPKIEKCEDEDPDEIDEVPVQARDLDDLAASLAAREEAFLLDLEIAAPDLSGDDDEEDHADRDVGAVKARDHEEGRAELRRAPGVAPGPHPFEDQLRPLEGLHADEGRA